MKGKDKIEINLQSRMDELLDIRRRYLQIEAQYQEIRRAGNKAYSAFLKELKASVKPRLANRSKG
jgi:hypothetical protein